MLIVKIELHSARDGHVEELGRMLIANDGTGTAERGSYDGRVGRKGTSTNATIWHKPHRTGRVENWPRQAKSVWRLVHAMLSAIYG